MTYASDARTQFRFGDCPRSDDLVGALWLQRPDLNITGCIGRIRYVNMR